MSGPDPDAPRPDDALPPAHQPYGAPPPPAGQPGQAGQPQQPWGTPPPPPPYAAAPPYAYGGPPVPQHPQATTTMVLGIAALAGLVTCQLLLVLGPFAWAMGARVCREIDAEPGRWQGRDRANVGRILGIVATVLLAVSVLVAIAAIVAVVAFGAFETWDGDVSVNVLGALGGAVGAAGA